MTQLALAVPPPDAQAKRLAAARGTAAELERSMKSLSALDLRLLHGLYDHGVAARDVSVQTGAAHSTKRVPVAGGFGSNGHSARCDSVIV